MRQYEIIQERQKMFGRRGGNRDAAIQKLKQQKIN